MWLSVLASGLLGVVVLVFALVLIIDLRSPSPTQTTPGSLQASRCSADQGVERVTNSIEATSSRRQSWAIRCSREHATQTSPTSAPGDQTAQQADYRNDTTYKAASRGCIQSQLDELRRDVGQGELCLGRLHDACNSSSSSSHHNHHSYPHSRSSPRSSLGTRRRHVNARSSLGSLPAESAYAQHAERGSDTNLDALILLRALSDGVSSVDGKDPQGSHPADDPLHGCPAATSQHESTTLFADCESRSADVSRMSWSQAFSRVQARGMLKQKSVARIKMPFSQLESSGGLYEVLSVDDEPINQSVVATMLPEDRYTVVAAMSGPEALELIFNRPHLPDLVLLDVMMPEISGLEVCEIIRQEYSNTELPIIMISARSAMEDIVAGLHSGANDYVTKPARHVELMSRINTQLAVKRAARMEAEAHFQRNLLSSMLPPHIIERLHAGEQLIANDHQEVTILFSDVVGFTEICSLLPTTRIIMMLDHMFTLFDQLCDKHSVYKVETIGDAYMVVAGHDGQPDHAQRMLNMAADMLIAVNSVRIEGWPDSMRVRIGMHTGPAYSGVVGSKCPRYCFFGDTVNTASRMESHGFPNAIHLSESTYVKLSQGPREQKTKYDIVSCGERHIKGKGSMETYLAKLGSWETALSTVSKSCNSLMMSYDNIGFA